MDLRKIVRSPAAACFGDTTVAEAALQSDRAHHARLDRLGRLTALAAS